MSAEASNILASRRTRTTGAPDGPSATVPLPAGLAPRACRPLASFSRTSLASCLALTGLCVVPQIASGVIPVGRCGDMVGKGGYTLRQAIANAPDGDTVDLSTLPVTCSTITLTGGAIPIPQANLTIAGPADRTITVSAANASRVFVHAGASRILIRDVTIANGTATPPGPGGCIYSNGTIQLEYSALSNCTANGRGGALYAKGDVQLTASSISGSAVHDTYAIGGAIYAHAVSLFQGSTVSGNHSDGYSGGIYASGDGEAYVSMINNNSAGRSYYGQGYVKCSSFGAKGSLTLNRTAVDGNSAGPTICANGSIKLFLSSISGNAGTGVGALGNASTVSIYDSTISGNDFYGITAGNDVKVHLYNTTIAQNAHGGVFASHCSLTSVSSILFGNGSNGIFGDIYTQLCTQSNSAYNIVGTSNIALPLTIAGNPQLTPLAYHGGRTRTHGLSINSPAIDAGSNPKASPYDQRDTGFARIVGARADVGAYERQPGDDELFFGGFD